MSACGSGGCNGGRFVQQPAADVFIQWNPQQSTLFHLQLQQQQQQQRMMQPYQQPQEQQQQRRPPLADILAVIRLLDEQGWSQERISAVLNQN